MNNNVTHPEHYTQGPIHPACGEVVECITVTEHHNFNVGNAIKYLWRADHKDNALEDLAKAAQYIQFEIDRRKYEAARNEPTLFEDDDKPARDFRINMGGFKTRVNASGHTHLNGRALDHSAPNSALYSPASALYSALLGAAKPDDKPGPVTLDDTNSHVCVNGQRVPGTDCGFRRLFGDITGTGV